MDPSSKPSGDEKEASLPSEHRFQLLVNAIKDYAIYLLDAQGHVSSWNTGAERLKGYTAEEIVGQHFSRFYTPEDVAVGLPARALKFAREQGKFESEGWRVRKDGTRFWTTVHIEPVLAPGGELIGYAKITRDLSQARYSEQALFASEQRFRLLVEGVRDYAIYMLDPSGRVTNWNAGAQLIKGYTAHEILGQHFSRFYTQEDQRNGMPARALQTALAERRYEAEAWRVRKDGTRFWASVVIDAIFDEAGQHIGFAKITRDITERKRAQDEMDRAREALGHAQKLEAVGRLTGGVAHDFNNFLTVIRSSVELLRRSGGDEERRERYIRAIAETADRAAHLTKQLLAFARQQPLRPEAFGIAQRVGAMAQVIETMVGATVKVDYAYDAELDAAQADPNQFDTALLNMVINAKDAMPTGGRLKISVCNVDEVPAVRRHPSVKGSFVATSVEDSGSGIEPLTLGRIFEPFFTTKPSTKGTGLGLSQVYGFAKQSGGEISVRSRVGEGTCFTLYLPRATTDAVDPTVPNGTTDALQKMARLSILLVEDNEDVGQFASGLLSAVGHSSTRAASAKEALEILESKRDQIDLVFSDVVMPGMDGVDLAKEIRSRWADLPVVLTSGYSHVLAVEGHHGFALLQKPYSIQELEAFLDRAVSSAPRRASRVDPA
ncbi:PAS domain S-box protein [Variovorax sp. J22R133]|uniref:hybrid sensor histidine kinase/response regulator n=1 Tax=Variovorax brevis TaxID=3053503 RepID=UPI0025751608|nr:PAS domain-containing sensor histidine kinase [Variovorax sp. J22R133]MDM0114039.1 PAS domain S-box protein [Variovorax sp. J22R133]